MKLRCPVCRGTFSWDPSKGFPDNCQLEACGIYIGTGRTDDDITMPSISKMRSAIGGQHDVYRQLEESSARRAEAAAQAAGVPVSEMANLKVTNLSDRKDTEIAEMPVSNDVTQQMDRLKQVNPNAAVGFGAGSEGGQAFAAGTATGAITVNGQVFTGITPRAGMDALSRIQRLGK